MIAPLKGPSPLLYSAAFRHLLAWKATLEPTIFYSERGCEARSSGTRKILSWVYFDIEMIRDGARDDRRAVLRGNALGWDGIEVLSYYEMHAWRGKES